MLNKNNSKLIIVFGVLLLLSIIVLIRNNSQSTANRNRSFNSELCEFDSAKVTSLTIYPKGGGEAVVLNKKADSWSVTINSKTYNADKNNIDRMLETVRNIRATRIAARDKDQWGKYEVTDSASTRVQVMGGKKTLADITVGKFSYQQPKNTNQNPYMQQQQGKLTSYMRLTNDKEVYAVDGMLSLTFNRNANDFRDHTIIKSDKTDWESISVTTPGESYLLKKQDKSWTIDGARADSVLVDLYLDNIVNVSNGNFIDEEMITDKTPSHILTIEGFGLTEPIEVSVFARDTTSVIGLSSSANEGTYFDCKNNDLIDKLFKDKVYFSNIAVMAK